MENQELIVSKQYGTGLLSDLALGIRRDVFVTEQNVPLALEIDDLDNQTTHYVGFINDKAIATARVLVNQEKNSWHIQRVATLSNQRGHGYANKIMQTIIDDAKSAGVAYLDLGAQVSAQRFYEKLGFLPFGDQFIDAGILHINMVYHF
ncbi:GNAT family N-acetyltransferase [Weissella diestrammenae]|uniref:GNAT family N-acetyltransferase n=1 Tax=Weissella diestrammenae TaxID=1162633 RepID=A0A7G9T792_9LACO|nr:GNAT family N-acetyltransferase [Weissella diestrammenae]MCM0582429.1 GNAT family N-acetyltransferase [Weissella diestrammenae]QNN75967.1 GNAT family N-acetyltransferase [Weissella diestrammenae]